MSNTWTTPGYGFIAGYGGENVAPGISDDRCISTIRDGVGCVSDNYASAMEICNSNPDCGGFICWDQTSADAVKNCYPLLTPMRLGVISSATQNAYVKQGAFVVINNARSVPFPISDSSLPSPPPPLPPPPAAVPVAPSESPISNAFSQSLQPSQNDDVRSTTTTEPVPIESTTSAGWSSSMSLAQVTTALLAAPNNIPVNSSTIATVELNGSPIQTPESASRTNSSSDSNTIIAVGVGSFAAALGVAGAIAFAVFLKRRKKKKADYSKNENVSVSAFSYPTKPAGRDSPAYTIDNAARGQNFAAAEYSGALGSVNVMNDSVSPPFSVQSSSMFAASTVVPSHRNSMAPPYTPPEAYESSQSVSSSTDVKEPLSFITLHSSSLSGSVFPETVATPLSMSSKSDYSLEAESDELHPQAWNARQTVNWLHAKRIASHIITVFETNRICGKELWDMDAYRISLLGLHAASSDVMKFLEEIQVLRSRFTTAGPALPVYQD